MPAVQRFRSALGGFNRTDVVQYIEYLNNYYKSEIQQLTTQLENASANSDLQAQLEEAQAKIAELEAKLAHQGGDAAELAAYRRAEKAERLANERAQKVCAKAEDAAQKVSSAADQAVEQFQVFSQSVQDAKASLQEAVDSMYAIRSEE